MSNANRRIERFEEFQPDVDPIVLPFMAFEHTT